MPSVTIEYEAAKSLDDLPKPIKARMIGLIARLVDWPDVSGTKPLTGKLAGRWRMRTGDYRMQFYIDDAEVVIEQVGHRDGFYEG